jgi:hypothetical protein
MRWAVLVVACGACKTVQPKPLDIVGGSAVDQNGLLVNPHWGGQVGSAAIDPTVCSPSGSAQDDPANWARCTSSKITTDRGGGCGPHVNWFPIQYSGTINWEDHSSPPETGADDDYNVRLTRSDAALYSKQNAYVLGEFDSDETIDHFGTAWWLSFKATVNGGNAGAQAMIKDKQAIAIGLAGLDCAGHELGKNLCYTELHPVYALAIHVNDDPGHDHWAFFIRNRGDEGYCSSTEQRWTPSRYTNGKGEYHLMLPAPNAKGFTTRSGDVRLWGAGSNHPTAGSYEAKLVAGQGLDLMVLLPDPATVSDSDDWILEGDLDLQFQ